MLYNIEFNIRLKDTDISIIKFGKNGDTISVFNSNNVARQTEGVYTINRIAGKREVLLVPKNNNIEKYGIPGTDI